ncbi:MAG: hypothetical protein SFV22_16955 [Saprospiraceae bacterium]|nr:hypothetical protein [Saprospiraceae bacterium]
MKKTKRNKPARPSPENKGIKNLDFYINEFGEIVRDVKTEEINRFLDQQVPDKKLTNED